MAMTIETITDTGLSYDTIETAERRAAELNAARTGNLFAKHFVRQWRFDADGIYHTIVCVNREVRP